jgi:hypothetical protein
VSSELYRNCPVEGGGWTEWPKATGQFARCCDPVSPEAKRAGSDAGSALLSESLMGKVSVGREVLPGSVERMLGRQGPQKYGMFSGFIGRDVTRGLQHQRKSVRWI